MNTFLWEIDHFGGTSTNAAAKLCWAATAHQPQQTYLKEDPAENRIENLVIDVVLKFRE